ncbi:MAG: HIT family protein [Candidatus Pacearchaeota archaeon]|jgi:histidine triad (HIT) family protein
METDKNCIFCRIISGEIPSVKIWEDKDYWVMLDAHPINPGHTLVIPKRHSDYIFDLNDRDYVELMLKSKTIAKTLKEKLKPKRVGIVVEGFGVHHVHIHLIPINKGEELNSNRAKNMDEKELNKIAQKIKGN